MSEDTIFAFLPILTILFYLAPIVFVIWFLVNFLKIQKERNTILKSISDKMGKH
ncbi:hypothetical protein [Bacillus sp. FJAT-27251]|uniref:hypothetical protein n=1 Tax=Bacillus sp. FJAT-27251 TaxID=1684142 RepID=UPI000A74D508|nr:hypothetical protein [Bacillus sp. FJAT-27251]